MSDLNFEKICFVIMPFGKKKVGDHEVDFNFIYDNVFKPAIEAVDLPADEGGGKLQPHRTDQDYFTSSINQDMFEYIEYSRFALADISGLNANVFYELGIRHRAHESGTAIFRQESGPPPFDITQIKAFPYEYEPQEKVAESIALIRKVLTESLKHNRLDSPPMLALRAQREQEKKPQYANIEPLLIEADNALRNEDWTTAIARYSEALSGSPDNPMVLMKRGLIYKDHGKWSEALADFSRAVELSPQYGEAYREKGIAENKLYNQKKAHERAAGMPTGEESLRKAIELKPDDFDALSSLGGVLKREERFAEAAELYRRATDISHGNTYPLLNEIKIKARIEGKLSLDGKHKLMLKRAEKSLRVQTANKYNLPWSLFDLAEIRLYLDDPDEFLQLIDEGILICKDDWQPETFRKSLQLLVDGQVSLPGLDEGIAKLKEAEEALAS
jgi:tetratricopeptide (TPR) repeat protein